MYSAVDHNNDTNFYSIIVLSACTPYVKSRTLNTLHFMPSEHFTSLEKNPLWLNSKCPLWRPLRDLAKPMLNSRKADWLNNHTEIIFNNFLRSNCWSPLHGSTHSVANSNTHQKFHTGWLEHCWEWHLHYTNTAVLWPSLITLPHFNYQWQAKHMHNIHKPQNCNKMSYQRCIIHRNFTVPYLKFITTVTNVHKNNKCLQCA